MKVKAIALALAALSAAGVANATTVHLTGASAIRNNVAAGLKNICVTQNGGTLTVYKQGAATNALANQMAYVCSVPFTGAIDTVFHTTTGGSLNSILGMSNQAAKQQIPVTLGGCAAAVAGSGALLGYSVRAGCTVGVATASNGGFSDLEYNPVREQVDILTNATDGFTIDEVTSTITGVAQAFGIGVSEKLYKDLQVAQGLIAGGCVSGDPLPACQPSLSKADLASMLNSNTFAPQKNGAENLQAGLTVGAAIEYARRVTTSGTQSSAQVYFLGKGCLGSDNGGQMPVIGDEVLVGATNNYNGGKFKVSANSGTSDVIAKLNAAGNTAYAFGVISLENRAPTTTTGWKFVKLNGVAGSDGTGTGLNKANALSGAYDFAFEAVGYKGPASKTNTDQAALIDAIASAMATPIAAGGAETVGLFITPDNAGGYDRATYPAEVGKMGRLGNSCQPMAAPF